MKVFDTGQFYFSVSVGHFEPVVLLSDSFTEVLSLGRSSKH